jgi:hypothetical protein
MTREEYYAFVEAVNQAEKISLREFEHDEEAKRYFEGCLPIEVLAARAPDALAFGPMRPVGLRDPRTGQRPFAVVQLRQDNVTGTLYNLVGFQTNIKWGDQERVLRMIPGLEEMRELDPLEAPFSGYVFKSLYSDMGKLSYVRVFSGTLVSGKSFRNLTGDKVEKGGHLFRPQAVALRHQPLRQTARRREQSARHPLGRRPRRDAQIQTGQAMALRPGAAHT